ncbi:MAG TPA: FG-GAP-like repeat-containing protein [Planctomycetota bacterium]|nr:FG-GAP-like repeat-containing protein [Planctomycetota bacterium]
MNRSSHRLLRAAIPPLFTLCVAPAARAQVFDYAWPANGTGGSFGASVSRIGDVDNDGAEDLIVGEPDYGGLGNGLARIFSGKTHALIDEIAGNVGAGLGAAVEGKIDLDGDGFPDVLVGAPDDSTGGSQAGAVLAYSPHLHAAIYTLTLNVATAQYGSSVRSLQNDLDGDGIDDFVVGAPGADTVFVLSGKTGSTLLFVQGHSGDQFGTSVSRAGDVDGDGFVDFAVGSPQFVNSSGVTTGRVTVFSGQDGSVIRTVNGAADSRFGYSLANPGDLDGDSVGDLVVGAPRHLDGSGIETGCVTVLSGATGSVIYKVFGDKKHDTFGHSVRSASGDVDDDGTSDFIVGAPQLTGSDVGYARTISGATGAVLFTFTEHTSDPLVKSDYGVAVAGGDFDGDGRTDVVVGGRGFNGGDGIAETWLTVVASWQNYGAGWAGTNGVPSFTPRTDPVVGKSMKVDLANSAGVATPAVLFLGFGKQSLLTGKGGTLLVVPFLTLPLSVPSGGLVLSGAIPDDPALYGFHLYLQALEADAGASKGISFTRGLDLCFGYP